MVMLVKEAQPPKVPSLILVTPFGMVILVNDVQSQKAPPPILVTLLPIVILVNDVQLSKALSPILVTLLDILTVASNSKPTCSFGLITTQKAKSPILVHNGPISALIAVAEY